MRYSCRLALGVVGAAVFLLLAIYLLPRLRIHGSPTWYDLGLYGAYPTQSYQTFQFESPSVQFRHQDPRCALPHILLNPRGQTVKHPGPVILDADGNLVWMETVFGETTNLQVQAFQGVDYLTFWAGEAAESYGSGAFYMLDSSYEVKHKILAVGDRMEGDLHEFNITPGGTALITIYDVKRANLSAISGPADGWIRDCVFQEVDIATGQLIFEWRTSDHLPLEDSFHPLEHHGRNEDDPYDFFHINSVDKDSEGYYYISGRHTSQILCISPSGSIHWILGGKRNQFEDLSGGSATNFMYQHHARWHPESGLLTMFDNRGWDYRYAYDRLSRGMSIRLDTANSTASLVYEYIDSQKTISHSQGSLQVLPGESNNVIVGWGGAPAFTEFTASGEVLCDVQFGASMLSDFSLVSSYRVFKATWVGCPSTQPAAVAHGDDIYVSWNGATEVVEWRLEAAEKLESEQKGEQKGEFRIVDTTLKTSFEEVLQIPESEDFYFRVSGLDESGKVLGTSEVIVRGPEIMDWRWAWWVGGVCAVATCLGVCCRQMPFQRIARAWEKRARYSLLPSS